MQSNLVNPDTFAFFEFVSIRKIQITGNPEIADKWKFDLRVDPLN